MGLERIKSGGKRVPGKLNSPTALSHAEKAARALEASARAGVSGSNAIGKAAPSGEAWTRATAGQTKIPGAAARAARAMGTGARQSVSGSNTIAPSATGGTGEAWTRAVPSQTRVPAPKAVSDGGIWSRGSRYSGIGSNPVAVPSRPASSAAAGRGRVSLEPERGYSPGGEKYAWGREAASRPAAPAPSVDYRRMVELNRMESELERAWRQNAASRSPEEPLDYSRMPSNMLAQRRNQAQIDLDTDAMIQIDQVLKARRAARGQQTLGDRVDDTLSGAFSGSGADVVNAVGTAANALHNPEALRKQIEAEYTVLEAGGYHYGGKFYPLSEEARKTIQDRIRILADKAWQMERPTSFVNRTYQLADRMREDSAASIASAKEGLGYGGQLAVDVGVAGTQMGLDAGAALLTGGSSLVPMAVRSFGSGAQEARLAGADLDQQLLYGVGSAALSMGTEKISNIAKPFQKMFGRGAAETIAGSLVKRFGENGAIQLMQRLSQTAAGRIALSAIGEGGEEAVEAVLRPFLKRAAYDPEARFDRAEAWNSALVGSILGLFGGGAEVAGSWASGPVRNQMGTSAGVDAALTEGVQSARGPSAIVQKVQMAPAQQNTLPGRETAVGMSGPAIEENTLLAESDLADYMQIGERKHVRNLKEEQLRQGQSPILTTVGQVRDFIRSALSGNIRDTIKAYGRVGGRMARDIQSTSGLDISGYYLELDANRICHLSDHIQEDGDTRNIPLTQEQAENLTSYIDSYDDVLDTVRRKDGSVRVTLGKRINGHAVIIELISKGRRSIQPVTAWQNTTEHYLKKYGNRNAQPIDASQLQEGVKRGYKPAVQETVETASTDNVPQSAPEVKGGADLSIEEMTPFDEGFYADEGFASPSGTDSGLVLDSRVVEAIRGREKGLSEQDCRHLNAVCKALGVRARFVEAIPGMRNAEARIMGSEILIAKDHQHPVRFVLGHELLHRMQTLAPEQYRAFREYAVQERGAPSAVEDKLGLYAGSRVALDYEGALDEITADYAGELFENGTVLDEFIRRHREDRTLLERLRDALRDLIGKLTGAERRYAQTAEGKLAAVLEESARQVERDTQNAARRDGGEQYIIKKTADGRKYVQADRPVMFGFDPEDWREQLETYINNKIRRGEDVQLIAEDGEVLTLTKDSAGKLASPYTSKGTTLPEDTYYTKVNAGAHIDELVQVSEAQGKTKADVGGRHGDFASGGWKYRTAYFQDYDGKHYVLTISVAQGNDGNIVYNIGSIRRRSPSDIVGSSAKGGAQGGGTPSKGSVPQDGGGVKPQYSLRAPAGAAGIEGPAPGWTAPAQGADPRLADLRAAYGQNLLFPRNGGDPLAWMYFLQMGRADRGDEEAFRALYEEYMRQMGGDGGRLYGG